MAWWHCPRSGTGNRLADSNASWRYLEPPLSRASLDFSDLRLRTVRSRGDLSTAEFRQLAAALEGRPDIQLQAYGNLITDLDFLQHFPRLRRLRLDLERVDTLDGLGWLSPDLDSFWVESRSPVRLGPLARFRRSAGAVLARAVPRTRGGRGTPGTRLADALVRAHPGPGVPAAVAEAVDVADPTRRCHRPASTTGHRTLYVS